MTEQIKAIVMGLLLVLSFACGWVVKGWRADAVLAAVELEQRDADLQAAGQALQGMAGFQKGFNDALSNFQQTQRANADAQADLGNLLLDLRSATAGVRSDFAKLPDRIASAAQPALAEYASTCTAVFEAMAAGGQRMAERGAELSAKADGHAADARLMQEAWPHNDKTD